MVVVLFIEPEVSVLGVAVDGVAAAPVVVVVVVVVVMPVVSVLDEVLYLSELLRVLLLQPAKPSERTAIAAATDSVILFVFIG